ncbi:MAG TPA: hypothetical protein VGR81_11700 [Candidatus Acidoferrales bacterium]|nr:hypothetical protein [Candidatus Acidoferrales bacterium]
MSNKSAPPKPDARSISEKAEAIAAAWLEARLVYPLYFYLTTHFHIGIPPANNSVLPAACPANDLFAKITQWLDEMDGCVKTNQLRQLLHSIKEIEPDSLRALIWRLLRRPEKSPTDRDNIDLLLATYFALCAPEDLYSCEITLGDVAQVLRNVLGDADSTELEWCAPLDQVLEVTKQCQGLREVFAAKLLEKGRELKDASGFMFYDPAALVAFTRFNFLLRRAFFRLLHADLRAIREGLTELERRGISTVDCRSAGLTAQEPIQNLREISLSWRQPISSDYAENSANKTFEQLLAIRAAVERALGIPPAEIKMPAIGTITARSVEGKVAADASTASEKAAAPKPATKDEQSATTKASDAAIPKQQASERRPTTAKVTPMSAQVPSASNAAKKPVVAPEKPETTAAPKTQMSAPAKQSSTVASGTKAADTTPPTAESKKPAGESKAPSPGNRNVPSTELEACLESIWEQLIEAPPSRGRSMSTITIGDAKILLSAWEVNAFVSDGGQLSEDLRRAVAARALVALGREEKKRTGDSAKVSAAIALGREEMGYLQAKVDQAQRTKNTEAAVNLGISARRLLSAIEEAQN